MTGNWFTLVHDEDKRLCVSKNKSTNDIDREMENGKSRKILELREINQKNFEYFIEKYGEEYEFLSFFWCPMISDFPLLKSLSVCKVSASFGEPKLTVYGICRTTPSLNIFGSILLKSLFIIPLLCRKQRA